MTSCIGAQLKSTGYVILESFISSDLLEDFICECEALRTSLDGDQSLIDQGCVVEPIVGGSLPDVHLARTSRDHYLLERRKRIKKFSDSGRKRKAKEKKRNDETISSFIFGSRVHQVAREILRNGEDENVYFFNEHYVIKPPNSTDSSFAWHTDEREQLAMCFPPSNTTPYVSFWIALDDMTDLNGTLVVAPGSHTMTTIPQSDTLEAAKQSVTIKAGSAVAFLSTLWHSSSPNTSSSYRRVYYLQYSKFLISESKSSSVPIAFAIPSLNCSMSQKNVLKKSKTQERTQEKEGGKNKKLKFN